MLHLSKFATRIIIVASLIFGLACLSSCKSANSDSLTCTLEDELVNGCYRLSWVLEGATAQTSYDVELKNGDTVISRNRPSLSYMDCDLEPSTVYTLTIKLKGHNEILKTIVFNMKDTPSNSNIKAVSEDNNITLSFNKQLEGSTTYVTINDSWYAKTANNSISVSSADVNSKMVSISERTCVEMANQITYNIVPYTAPLQITVASSPSISFNPSDGNHYVLKCDKFNKFQSFDVTLSQDNQELVSENNILKKDMVNGKIVLDSTSIGTSDLNLSLVCHGERTTSSLTPDIRLNKQFTYVPQSSLSIVNGALEINDTVSSVTKYLVTQTAYSTQLETSFELKPGQDYSVPTDECYKIAVLPVINGSYFTSTSIIDWFQYYHEPTVTLVSEEGLYYNIKADLDSYSQVVISLTHDGNTQILKNIDFVKGSATFSLTTLGLIKDAGEYLLEAYVAPLGTTQAQKLDGTPYTVFSSSVVSRKIIKTAIPSPDITKINNGSQLKFSVNSYDTYHISVGTINDTFNYNNGVSSYILSNTNFIDSTTRTIKITCTKNIYNDDNTVVLTSDPFVIDTFKVLSTPTASLSLVKKDNVSYFQLSSSDNYYAELYYENGLNSKILCGSSTISNSDQWSIEDMTTSALQAGSYILSLYKTAKDNYTLNSTAANYYFTKLQTPILNKSRSSSATLYWDTTDTVSGYTVSYDTVSQTTRNNNYVITESALNDGETAINIVANGSGLVLDSEPLTVKLYKMSQIDVAISNSILTYTSYDKDISIGLTTELFRGDTRVLANAQASNNIDLIKMTAGAEFNVNEAVTYTVYMYFTGNSSVYDYVYGIKKTIDFTKQAYPSINMTTKQFTENNGNNFVMAIDNDNFIYNNTNAPIPSGKHTIKFKVLGDGVTTIDSNVMTYVTGS